MRDQSEAIAFAILNHKQLPRVIEEWVRGESERHDVIQKLELIRTQVEETLKVRMGKMPTPEMDEHEINLGAG